jgi:hypothetical protein
MASRIVDMIFYWHPVGAGQASDDQRGTQVLKVELHGTAGGPVASYFPATPKVVWAILDLNQ